MRSHGVYKIAIFSLNCNEFIRGVKQKQSKKQYSATQKYTTTSQSIDNAIRFHGFHVCACMRAYVQHTI